MIGMTKTLEMVMIGNPINAENALRIGLLNKVVPDDKLWDEVESIVRHLADMGSIALDMCKKAVHKGGQMPLRNGLEYERDCFCGVLLTEDSQEGHEGFYREKKASLYR